MKFLYLLGYLLIGMISSPVSADIAATVEILRNHPQVLGEKAKGLASDARVAQQSAQWLPNISLSTDGGRRILGTADSIQSRSLGSNDYLDLVVTGRQLLYDFGAVDGYVNEAKYRSQADAYLDEIALNKLVGDLVQFSLQYQIELERSQIIADLIGPLTNQSKLSKQRYDASVTNGDDYRRLQMDLDRLSRDQVEVDKRIKDISQKLAEQFALNADSAIEFSNSISSVSTSMDITERLSDKSRRLREIAANYRVSAAEAERKPRIDLEMELRGFDVTENYASENELTGNLQITMPFFDGGSLKAKAAVAEFERAVVQQEQAFEQRVLRERTSQIKQEKRSLSDLLTSLDSQRFTAQEALAMSLERQGKTSVEISQINSSLMSIYQLDNEILDSRLRKSQLDLELITLNERWPAKVERLVMSLEK